MPVPPTPVRTDLDGVEPNHAFQLGLEFGCVCRVAMDAPEGHDYPVRTDNSALVVSHLAQFGIKVETEEKIAGWSTMRWSPA